MSSPTARMDVTDLQNILKQNETQLELELAHIVETNTDLKKSDNKLLTTKKNLKKELDKATKDGTDDTSIKQKMKDVDDQLKKNGEDLKINEAKHTLVKSLQQAKTKEAASSSSKEDEDVEFMAKVMSKMGMMPKDMTPKDTKSPSKKTIGRLPEYALKEDFDLFLQRFKTYVQLNDITEAKEQKLLLDTCLSDEAKKRCGYITALDEPYSSQSFKDYADLLKLRFYPKARSLLYKSGYDAIAQKADQNVQDYTAMKFSAFLKAYAGFPFEFFVRTLIEKLYNEELKTEVIRAIGDMENEKETNTLEQQKLFAELMEIINVALDLCRRTSGLSAAQLQKNGLNIDNVDNEGTGNDSASKTSSSSSTTVAQMDEDQMMEVFPEEEFEYDEQADLFYEMPEEEAEEPGLTSHEVDFCFKLESEQETAMWEREPTEEEVALINQSPTKKLCFTCNSSQHLNSTCPTRLRIVQQRNQRMFQQSGRQQQRQQGVMLGYRGGQQAYRDRGDQRERNYGRGGPSRGGFRGGARGGGSARGWRGRSSAPRPSSLQPFQARSSSNPYNPSQAPSRFGPNPATFFR